MRYIIDSRNFIKNPIPEVKGGQYLEMMYDLQKKLLEGYINGKEGLPMYPININPKANQQLLKDFMGRVIEEMAECHQELEDMHKWIQQVVGGILVTSEDLIGVKDYLISIFKSHWQDMGEEVADTLHFFLELLIYSNINPQDINGWMDKIEESMGTSYSHYPTLDRGMRVGGWNNYDNIVMAGIDLYNCFEPTEEEKLYLPKRYFNWGYIESLRLDLWDVTQSLNMARNKLKNRPWKNSEETADTGAYQYKLVEAFIYYLGYLSHLGLTPLEIYRLYVYKNRANIFRQKSNY